MLTRRRCLVLAGCLLLAGLTLLSSRAAADFKVLYEKQSPYSKVIVREDPDGMRQLVFDDATAVQSEVDVREPQRLILSYSKHIMAALPLVEKPQRFLIVGLGGASMPRFIHRLLSEVHIDNAEIDPVVADVARRFFFLKEDDRLKVHVIDGRKFIEQPGEKYDIIFLDAFGADWIPYSLATQEFLKATKARLAEGGIVAANVWFDEPTYPSMLKTYQSVFPEVHLLRCAYSGNMIVIACGQKMNLTERKWQALAKSFERAHPTGLDLPALIGRGYRDTEIPVGARILLDKDAPKK